MGLFRANDETINVNEHNIIIIIITIIISISICNSISIIMQQWKLSVCYTVKRNTGRLGVACAPASETRIKR